MHIRKYTPSYTDARSLGRFEMVCCSGQKERAAQREGPYDHRPLKARFQLHSGKDRRMTPLERRNRPATRTTLPALRTSSRTIRPVRASTRAWAAPAAAIPQAQALAVGYAQRPVKLPVGLGLGIAFLISLVLWASLIIGARALFF